jgi:hypothetical protein
MSQLNLPKTYLYSLYNEIIYDPLSQIYVNILTLNKHPEGALKTYTKLMALIKPYTNDLITTKECAIVINNSIINNNYNNNSILTLNDLNEFTEFLINNNYIITDYSYNANSYNANSYNANSSKKLIYSFKITL